MSDYPDPKWDVCELCGPMLRCQKCNMNSCSPSWGGEPGNWCDVCPSVCEYHATHTAPEWAIDKYKAMRKWQKRNPDWLEKYILDQDSGFPR